MLLVRHGQSEFNVVFSVTRRDPGIRDPLLTELGHAQAEAAAEALVGRGVERLIASPYTRALQTAAPIARRLGLTIEVDPIVGERAAFACDVGTPRTGLIERFPEISLHHLDEQWWPELEESEERLAWRCGAFRDALPDPHDHIVVVTHWGFIRGLTGLTVQNGTAVRLDPQGVEVVHPVVRPGEP
jgi:broad specificity phosphatase PhoE